jgi:hypothetical protein
MESNHHGERRGLPKPNPECDSQSERDGKSGDTYANAFVSADYHGVEHANDHAAELGLVQQRHGPHRQQLLESV